VFAEFVKFKATIELETGNKLKILRSDNGGEYTSRQLSHGCGVAANIPLQI